MANTKSAKKRALQGEKRRIRNRRYLGLSRKAVKEARLAIEGGDATAAEEAVRDACAALDRAATRGVIHQNNASRRKSRLVLRFNEAFASA